MIKRYKRIVGKRGIDRARKDHYSKRKPIACGLTIHPGYNCSFGCIYCYITELGFRFGKPKLNKLSKEELALALLYNPNFEIGRTYLAIGSITEPFLPELEDRTIDYISELAKFKNPIQFSTKAWISKNKARQIFNICQWISPLITIITLDLEKAKLLEPGAPPPNKRLRTIQNLARAGMKPFLFLRPLLRGIVGLEECIELIKIALERGAHGVVVGSLRINKRIFERMSGRFELGEIRRRIGGISLSQKEIDCEDIIVELMKEFKGCPIFRRACCASAYCSGLERCYHENLR